jgi:hypothetical protein
MSCCCFFVLHQLDQISPFPMAQLLNNDPVLFKVQRAIIAANGIGGLKLAVNAFRNAQVDLQTTSLTPQQFYTLLTQVGAPELTERERKHLFLAFDEDRNGKVAINEFVRHLTSPLNPRRRLLIKNVFAKFEADGAAVRGAELASTHSSQKAAKTHAWNPTVFDDVFGDQLASESGKVTLEEFLAFYSALSLHKSLTDDDFELAVLREWGADAAHAPILNETERDWSSTVGGNPLVHDTVLAKDAKNRSLGLSTGQYNADHMKRTFVPNRYLPDVLPDYITTTTRSFPKYSTSQIRSADPMYVPPQQQE